MRRASVMSEPMPRIMVSSWAAPPAAIHRRAHRLYRIRKTREDRLADQEVPDIELGDFGQRRDAFGGDEIEAVAGMDFEAEAFRHRGAADDAVELDGRGRGVACGQR